MRQADVKKLQLEKRSEIVDGPKKQHFSVPLVKEQSMGDDVQTMQKIFEANVVTTHIISRNNSIGTNGGAGNLHKRCDTVVS